MALTNAEKQARHREKVQRELDALRLTSREMLEAFVAACERGRCYAVFKGLPDDPGEAMAVLATRLAARRLIVCTLEEEAASNG